MKKYVMGFAMASTLYIGLAGCGGSGSVHSSVASSRPSSPAYDPTSNQLIPIGGQTAQQAGLTNKRIDGADRTIHAFNRTLWSATRAMDYAATLELWEEDGTNLLPDTHAMEGKPAIAQFLASVDSQLRGARMQQFELTCHDVRTSGDWGSEWCDEHQLVTFADGRPPFNGGGRLLLVLHRGADHGWRIQREMWQLLKAP